MILAFEKGYSALPGVMAKPINSWGDFRKTLKLLADPTVKERYSTIIIDTADIAYQYCERFVCNNNDVDAVSDIAYGKGYGLVGAEFDEGIRKILQMDYGLVLISHSTEKTFKNEKGEEYTQICPTLDKRGRLICERTCDIIGYSTPVQTEDGVKTYLFMRGTPQYVAGSRFAYIPDHIEFNYHNLVAAINEAIDKQAQEDGNEFFTDEATRIITQDIEYDYDYLMSEISNVIGQLMEQSENNAIKITAIVEKNLGRGKKVGECGPAQSEQLDLILSDLKELVK